ncbi:MAG: anaerobic sulfite reductase subunit AsrA [Breznakia sp.]
MGFQFDGNGFNRFIQSVDGTYEVYAPVRFKDGGIHANSDMIRYQQIRDIEDVVFDEKSAFSFKEVVLPIMQTLFYFNEDQIREPNFKEKGAIVLLRHCDMHALKRLDTIYLKNGPEDHYYKQVRKRIKFAVMGCQTSFENCFCVSMDANVSDIYDFSIDLRDGFYYCDVKDENLQQQLKRFAKQTLDIISDHVLENDIRVHIPKDLSARVAFSSIWDEYDTRCIACGRCNFVCPTCTCTTTQDIFYQDNARVGERKRVWASCMVDGFSEVAGGGSCRKKHGERMRFKVLHKVLDYKQRFDAHMCTGCGRCDDVCPEYISFSNAINKLEGAMKELAQNEK